MHKTADKNIKEPLTLHPLPQGERQIRKVCCSGLYSESRFLHYAFYQSGLRDKGKGRVTETSSARQSGGRAEE